MALQVLEKLWNKHYVPGVAGSYHGDMARTFASIGGDTECDGLTAQAIMGAVRIHCRLERMPSFEGRKWFCEYFGTVEERAQGMLAFRNKLEAAGFSDDVIAEAIRLGHAEHPLPESQLIATLDLIKANH